MTLKTVFCLTLSAVAVATIFTAITTENTKSIKAKYDKRHRKNLSTRNNINNRNNNRNGSTYCYGFILTLQLPTLPPQEPKESMLQSENVLSLSYLLDDHLLQFIREDVIDSETLFSLDRVSTACGDIGIGDRGGEEVSSADPPPSSCQWWIHRGGGESDGGDGLYGDTGRVRKHDGELGISYCSTVYFTSSNTQQPTGTNDVEDKNHSIAASLIQGFFEDEQHFLERDIFFEAATALLHVDPLIDNNNNNGLLSIDYVSINDGNVMGIPSTNPKVGKITPQDTQTGETMPYEGKSHSEIELASQRTAYAEYQAKYNNLKNCLVVLSCIIVLCFILLIVMNIIYRAGGITSSSKWVSIFAMCDGMVRISPLGEEWATPHALHNVQGGMMRPRYQ